MQRWGRTEVLADMRRITTMQINVDKIRDVIGPGGKMIREICETTGAKIDIEDDGTVKSQHPIRHRVKPRISAFTILSLNPAQPHLHRQGGQDG